MTCQLSLNHLTDEEFTEEDYAIMAEMHEPEVDADTPDDLALLQAIATGHEAELTSTLDTDTKAEPELDVDDDGT